MSTVQLNSTDPSGMGRTLCTDSTRARKPVQLWVARQPIGWLEKTVVSLPVSGLGVQFHVMPEAKSASSLTPAMASLGARRTKSIVTCSPGGAEARVAWIWVHA